MHTIQYYCQFFIVKSGAVALIVFALWVNVFCELYVYVLSLEWIERKTVALFIVKFFLDTLLCATYIVKLILLTEDE